MFGMLYKNGLNMIIFLKKLFYVSLDSTKIIFCPIQGCFSGESFVLLKGVGQACLVLYIRANRGWSRLI